MLTIEFMCHHKYYVLCLINTSYLVQYPLSISKSEIYLHKVTLINFLNRMHVSIILYYLFWLWIKIIDYYSHEIHNTNAHCKPQEV
jgi:hypothetical protein